MTDKVFIATYKSENNLFSGELVIFANRINEAQDNFFAWLKNQDVYNHMWQLSVEFREVDDAI